MTHPTYHEGEPYWQFLERWGERPDDWRYRGFVCTGDRDEVAALADEYPQRWHVEVAFKASQQVMKIQAPQHWCQQSIEKLSPWAWLMQSVISLWYMTEGHKLPQARAARQRFGEWDTEWSFAHMLRILRAAILAKTMNPKSATKAELHQLLHALENYLFLAT